MGDRVRMEVIGLALDSTNNSPIVLLREVLGDRLLPIWIGVIEASAIAFELEKVDVARPLTHDLLMRATEALGARLVSAVISDLKDNTFIAELRFKGPSGDIVLDARPSDALALALKGRAPIECEENVLERIRGLSDLSEVRAAVAANDANSPVIITAEEDVEAGEELVGDESPKAIASGAELNQLLETLEERDFGKYKM
jgi:uncharacterized protein